MSNDNAAGAVAASRPTGGRIDHAEPSRTSRVDLRRVLSGLRHLEASPEPVRVFAELAAVCVPALSDVCLIQIAERGQRPYRIRRTWPDPTPVPPRLTDEAFTAVIQSRGTPLDGSPGAGVVVEITARDVLARFGNPPGGGPEYQGVVACRWTMVMSPT